MREFRSVTAVTLVELIFPALVLRLFSHIESRSRTLTKAAGGTTIGDSVP